MPQPPRPTEAELEILRALWTLGPATVRQVADAIAAQRGGEVGYTTVLKTMQIMAEKALVRRDESARSHVYRPAVPEDKTLRQLAGDLLHRAFGGSTEKLLLSALSARKASPEELAEIRKVLDSIESSANSPNEQKHKGESK